ncbi:crossover junction endodeoxyribonuclease RuvC [Deltaproteobacteria bacterium TL4]
MDAALRLTHPANPFSNNPLGIRSDSPVQDNRRSSGTTVVRILGIDPGSRKTGYGLIESQGNRICYLQSGFIRLGEALPLADRLVVLAEQLDAILQEFKPECGALEQIFLGKNVQSALTLGHARGVILLKLRLAQMPVYEYTPLEVKQTVVGVGRADKAQVEHMVRILLNQKTRKIQEDEADALAVAITHSHLIPFRQKQNDRIS